MQDRPNVDELLEAVAGFLHGDVMANTTGRINFHARVAGNVIEMLRRELNLEEGHVANEWGGLDALLGAMPRPASLSAERAALTDRNDELATRIRAGEFDADPGRASLLAHLRSTMRDKLAVSNPGLVGPA